MATTLNVIEDRAQKAQKREERRADPHGWAKNPAAKQRIRDAGHRAIRDYVLAEAVTAIQQPTNQVHTYRHSAIYELAVSEAVRIITKLRGEEVTQNDAYTPSSSF